MDDIADDDVGGTDCQVGRNKTNQDKLKHIKEYKEKLRRIKTNLDE